NVVSPKLREIGWSAAGAGTPDASAATTAIRPTERRKGRNVAEGNLCSPSARVLRGKARSGSRRREPALDCVGDREAPRRGRCRTRVHLPGRTHREERARFGRLG